MLASSFLENDTTTGSDFLSMGSRRNDLGPSLTSVLSSRDDLGASLGNTLSRRDDLGATLGNDLSLPFRGALDSRSELNYCLGAVLCRLLDNY